MLIEEVRFLVKKYSQETDPVLLLGETGSGKNRVAELFIIIQAEVADLL